MTALDPTPQTETEGPPDVKIITFVGGPMNGKKMADTKQTQWVNEAGDLYKRVELMLKDDTGSLPIHVLAYFGLTWRQDI